MGCSRESFNIFKVRGMKSACRYILRVKRLPDYIWSDSFMPFVCKVVGHKPYKPEQREDEWACLRCHVYIKPPKAEYDLL